LYPHSGLRLPALVVAVQGPTREITAVQVTYLRPSDGTKAPVSQPRLTFGILGRGAARLARATEVLGLSEGTEDAMAAMVATGCPCWATLGAGRMHCITVPDSVTELNLFADDDVSGREAVARTARIHRLAGRTVVTRLPPEGFKDWGELALARSGSSVAA
jgi:hypothetical protein